MKINTMFISKFMCRQNLSRFYYSARIREHIKFLSTAAAAIQQEKPVRWEEAKPFSEIPGPKSYPLVKSLPYALTKLPARIDQLSEAMHSLCESYGPLVRWEMPLNQPLLLVADPAIVEYILKHGQGKWPSHSVNEFFGIYRKETRKEWYDGVAGILPENGQAWWDIRSKVQQPMMRPKASQLYLPAMSSVADDFINHIRLIRDRDIKEVPADFQDSLYKWSLESIGVVALNTRLGCLDLNATPDSDGQVMINATQALFKVMGQLQFSLKLWKYYPSKSWRTFVKEMDKVSLIGMKYIHKEIENLQGKKVINTDELSMLEKFLITPGLTKGVAVAMTMDMLFAGIETTGNAMGFFLSHLSKNPKVQQRIQEEVDQVLTTPSTPLTATGLSALPYLKAAIKETMRLTPITIGFARSATTEVVIDGYRVPKGTMMILYSMEMCRNDEHYPDALKFKPERWLRGDSEEHTANPYTYTPFGHGSRMCIGRRLAEQEMWTLAAKIMQNFNVEYHYDGFGITSQITNKVREPLRFQFHDRKTHA